MCNFQSLEINNCRKHGFESIKTISYKLYIMLLVQRYCNYSLA